jgi:hypothetical protein
MLGTGYGQHAPNKIGRANRRPASPCNAGRQFESASCAPPFLSAAVAHLWRSAASAGRGAGRGQSERVGSRQLALRRVRLRQRRQLGLMPAARLCGVDPVKAEQVTRANAGGRRQLPMPTRRAARVAQFCRWAA